MQYGVKIAYVRYNMHTDEYIGYTDKFRIKSKGCSRLQVVKSVDMWEVVQDRHIPVVARDDE